MAERLSALQEWRMNWGMLMAAFVGLSFGTLSATTLGLFMEPLESEFGWTRTLISAGITVNSAIGFLLLPFAGGLSDRIGARMCIIPGLAISGLTFAAFGLMNGSPVIWFAIWIAFSTFSLLIRSVIWSGAVSKAFVASRSTAIAFVLSGYGVGQIVSPPLTQMLIADFGWRMAYFILGIAWPGIALVLAIFFFHDRTPAPAPGTAPSPDAQASPAPTPTGVDLSLRQAMRDPAVLRITAAHFLCVLVVGAIIVPMVPILQWAGTSLETAAWIAGFFGVGSIAGKIIVGPLMDHLESRILPACVFAMPAVCCLLIWQGGSSPITLALGTCALGLGAGGGLTLATYLTSRFAGLRNFGAIFGLMSSLIALSMGIGPLISGWIYDATGSYVIVFWIGIPLGLIAGLIILGLGPYPDSNKAMSSANSPR